MVSFQIQILDLLNIPAIILLGLLTSVSDIRQHKIPNKYITIAVAYSFISLGVADLYLLSKGESVSPDYLKLFAINLCSSLFFGAALWLSNLWSAGDAKLFVAYASLIPLSTYKWGTIGIFPSYIVLINIFTPAFVFMLFRLIAKTRLGDLISEMKRVFSLSSLFSFIFFTLGFSWLAAKAISLMGLPSSIITSMLVMILLFLLLKTALRKNLNYISIIALFLRVIADSRSIVSIPSELVLVGIIILMRLIIGLGYYAFTKDIYIEDLQPGMSLAEQVYLKNGKCTKFKELKFSSIQFMTDKAAGELVVKSPSRITLSDAAELKQLHSSGALLDHRIRIREELPFAIMFFCGIILTLLFRGNIFISILKGFP